MQQTQCKRKAILDILYTIQILYQNNQIDDATKDRLAQLAKTALSNESFVKHLSAELKALKRVVDVGFKDTIYECLDKLD